LLAFAFFDVTTLKASDNRDKNPCSHLKSQVFKSRTGDRQYLLSNLLRLYQNFKKRAASILKTRITHFEGIFCHLFSRGGRGGCNLLFSKDGYSKFHHNVSSDLRNSAAAHPRTTISLLLLNTQDIVSGERGTHRKEGN
jgi:hypothetical protein